MPFKKIAEEFSDGHNLPDISEKSQTMQAPSSSKKLKTDTLPSTSTTSSESILNKEENTETEEFHSSYVLTMSQMISDQKEGLSKHTDDSEYIFEPCTQVCFASLFY